MNSILSIKGMTKRFGGLVAVNNVDLEVAEKSISSVIGPNGAGKTTFFNLITGFYQADTGEILFQGQNIGGLSTDRITHSGIARTYQNIRLFSNLTALENILVGMHTRLRVSWLGAIAGTRHTRTEEKKAHEQARKLLAYVGLAGKGDVVSRNLPYGDQRRLEIGRALASEPKLLLLDEPAAGMNPQETADIASFIRRLRDDLGITILLIEHDMRVVMEISEQISVLDYGQKIAEGLPADIQNNRRVIEAYLGRDALAALEGEDAQPQASGGEG